MEVVKIEMETRRKDAHLERLKAYQEQMKKSVGQKGENK